MILKIILIFGIGMVLFLGIILWAMKESKRRAEEKWKK